METARTAWRTTDRGDESLGYHGKTLTMGLQMTTQIVLHFNKPKHPSSTEALKHAQHPQTQGKTTSTQSTLQQQKLRIQS